MECNQNLDNKGEETKFLHSYLAGLWDGEGSFMLPQVARRSHGVMSPNKAPSYVPTAQICLTVNGVQEIVMHIFKERYDGCLHLIKDPPSKNKNGKPVLMWRGTSQKASRIATDLLPYLRIKHRQAEIVIRFAELQAMNREKGSRWYPENHQPERLALVEEIRRLNKRGKI